MIAAAAIGASAALLGLAGLSLTRLLALGIERRHPPTGRFVTVGRGRLHVVECMPDGPPRGTVVLLHGASGNQADIMLPLGPALAAKGFRVVAPDRPGHGWSDRFGFDDEALPTRQAAIIRRGLAAIGVERAVIVGHSWSGALGVAFALDHRDLTAGLVLLAPVLYPWPGGVAWYYGPVTRPWIGRFFTSYLTLPLGLLLMRPGIAEVFDPQPPPPEFVTRTGIKLVLRPATFTANARDVNALHAFVTRQAGRLRAIAVPTAIVAGDRDTVVPTGFHGRRGADEIPGATLTVLPDVGHSPHWADPDSIVDAVIAVADRADAASKRDTGDPDAHVRVTGRAEVEA